MPTRTITIETLNVHITIDAELTASNSAVQTVEYNVAEALEKIGFYDVKVHLNTNP